MSNKLIAKKSPKKEYVYDISFKELTLGEVMCLRNALINYKTSPIAPDLLGYLDNGLTSSKEERLKEALNSQLG